MEEIWRPIPGYETIYEVSNVGNIHRVSVTTKLTNADLASIRELRTQGESFGKIAKRFHVTKRAIISALTYPTTFSFRTPYRILTPQKNTHGYLAVQLCKDGKPCQHSIHTLVAKAFLGTIPPKWCVNHLNGNRRDNRVENLEIVTIRDNARHAYHVLGIPGHGQKGSANGHAKLREADIPFIRAMRTEGQSYRVIGDHFHVSPDLISRIIRGMAWRHVPTHQSGKS